MASITQWTREDDKRFETALMLFPIGSPYFLEEIANHLKKPLRDVKYYYDALVHDVDLIESGNVALPKYPEDDYVSLTEATQSKTKEKGRKKGIPWSAEEHRLFLDGLNKYGKGDWKSISRECVKTRTPTQVASHAQKHFLKLENSKDNVTVPGSNLINSTGQEPHFSDQIPPDQYGHSQDNFGFFDDDELYHL